MLTDPEKIQINPIVNFANLDYQKFGNFCRPIKVNDLIDKYEEKPGIKFEFVGKYARIKNAKANSIINTIGNHPRSKPDKFIVINRDKINHRSGN